MQGQNCLTVEFAENLESSFLNGDFELWDVCVSMGKNWLLLMLPQSPIDQQREEKEKEKERGGLAGNRACAHRSFIPTLPLATSPTDKHSLVLPLHTNPLGKTPTHTLVAGCVTSPSPLMCIIDGTGA